jgi:mannose-6-phosphate isomerase-like protein (cupin superfamily)
VTGDAATQVGPGDVIVVSPGEPHRTRNTGSADLVSLCFFPVPDLARVTTEVPGAAR